MIIKVLNKLVDSDETNKVYHVLHYDEVDIESSCQTNLTSLGNEVFELFCEVLGKEQELYFLSFGKILIRNLDEKELYYHDCLLNKQRIYIYENVCIEVDPYDILQT